MCFFGVSDFSCISQDSSTYPFPQIQGIVFEAKYILEKRTREEIIKAANTIDWVIEEYFEKSKYDVIQDILNNIESINNYVLGYLPYEERDEAGITGLINDWPFEADNPCPYIPSSHNTSRLEALTECIGIYSLDDYQDFLKGHESEYFAVLALIQVGECLMALSSDQTDNVFNFSTTQLNMITIMNSLEGKLDSVFPYSLALAGKHAVDAMGAIYYAQHLRTIEKHKEELKALRAELHQESNNIEALAEHKSKNKISLNAKKAAIKRHEKSRQLKDLAIHLYLAKTWPSIMQASKKIFPELVEHGKIINFVFSPERGQQTVYEWLLAASKKIRKRADV